MSKNFSNHEASSLIEDEIQDPDVVKLQNRTKSFEEAMHKPVSNHVDKLDKNIETLLKDLENSRKDLQNLKLELLNLNSNFSENNLDLRKCVSEEIYRIDEFFRKNGKKDRDELDFLGQQMKQLKLDKTKLDETADILNIRIRECENDVGFRHIYD